MTPYRQLRNGLQQIRQDSNELLDEAIAFAEVMAMKQNSIELDEKGIFFVTASGTIEDVIPTMYKQLEKLERIKQQKDSSHG